MVVLEEDEQQHRLLKAKTMKEMVSEHQRALRTSHAPPSLPRGGGGADWRHVFFLSLPLSLALG